MKVKLKKFDKAQVVEFLTAHVEKMVFGAFAILFLLFCYGALRQKPYDKRPADFDQKSSQVESTLASSTPNPSEDFPAEPPVPQFNPVNATAFVTRRVWNQPLFEVGLRRPEPKLLTAQELQVGTGYGAIAFMAEEAPPGTVAGGGVGGEPGPGPGGVGGGLRPSAGGMGALGGGMGTLGGGGGMGKNKPGGMGTLGGGAGMGAARSGGGGMGANRPGGMGTLGGGGMGTLGGGLGPRPPAGIEGPPGSMADEGDFAAEQPLIVAPSNAIPKGRQWAVVTALVPIREQFKEYRNAFQNARRQDPNTDQPIYERFEVERAETAGDTPADELKWQAINLKVALADERRYAVAYPETVDPNYVSERLTRPLPPMIGKNHDRSVGHPKIPFAADTAAQMATEMAQPGAVPAEGDPSGESADPFGRSGGPGGPQPPGGGMGALGGGMGTLGGGGMGRPRPPGMGSLGAGGMGTMGGGMGRAGGMGSMGGGYPQPGMGGMGGAGGVGVGGAGHRIDYLLLRFFDYAVKPGKTYRYRVRLVLTNPNYGLPAMYLTDSKLAQGETRPSLWSEPSPPVAVPRGSSLLAGSIKPAKGLAESKAEVLVRMWDAKRAVDALQEKELVRGQMANFAEKVPIDDPALHGSVTEQDVSFRTDSLLVDMTGGETLKGRANAKAPAQLLVMEPDGTLRVRSELADAESYDPDRRRLKKLKEVLSAAETPPPASDGEEPPLKPARPGKKSDKLFDAPGSLSGKK